MLHLTSAPALPGETENP